MGKTLQRVSGIGIILFFLFATTSVFATESLKNTITNNLTNTGTKALIDTSKTIGHVVGGVVVVALGLLGLIFLILLVYGGFKWMESQGEDKKVAEARGMIYQAIIGLAIILAAYAITEFFVTQLQSGAGINLEKKE